MKKQRIENSQNAEAAVWQLARVRMHALKCASMEIRGPRLGIMRVKYFRANGTVVQTFWFRLKHNGCFPIKADGAAKTPTTIAFATVKFRPARAAVILN